MNHENSIILTFYGSNYAMYYSHPSDDSHTFRLASEKQTVQNWIAESATEIYGARLMVMDCAKKVQELQTKGARKEISMIKLRVADVLMKILDRAIQAHGALGITDYTPLAYWYRHERGARIYDGADEVHKNLIARTILKKYIG